MSQGIRDIIINIKSYLNLHGPSLPTQRKYMEHGKIFTFQLLLKFLKPTWRPPLSYKILQKGNIGKMEGFLLLSYFQSLLSLHAPSLESYKKEIYGRRFLHLASLQSISFATRQEQLGDRSSNHKIIFMVVKGLGNFFGYNFWVKFLGKIFG